MTQRRERTASPAPRVTRADVARVAGTSTAVVSYVLNDGPRPVSDAARERVLAAIAETGYRPNHTARALASGSTRTLGLVVPDIANPFFAALAHALEDEASRHGLVLLLGDAGEHVEREVELVQNVVDRDVDGLVLVGVGAAVDLRPAIDAGVPVVVLDRRLDGATSTVGIDNRAAARQAVEHLLGHGARRPRAITGPEALPTAAARAEGFRDALAAAGIAERPGDVVHAGFDRAGGYREARAMLRGVERPDAIFAASEQQAIGVLRAAHEARVRVPEDLAVATIDGTEASTYAVPSLTTIAQPFAAMAAEAVALVLRRDGEPRSVTCEHELILRRSCGCEETPIDDERNDA